MAATSVEVTFPYNSLGALSRVLRATLRRREYQHEMLILETYNYTTQQLNLRTGDPVSATLKGFQDLPTNFVGHFHHLIEHAPFDGNQARSHTIVCVGPTFKMKNGRQKVWKNVLASDIARAILRDHRLTADVETSSNRMTINQAGESDWSFLCRIARQIGYVVYAVGTVVHFHSRDRDFSRDIASAATLSRSGADTGWEKRTQIRTFTPLLGEVEQPGAAKGHRIVRGIDPRSGQIVGTQHDGKPTVTTRANAQPGIFQIFEPGVVANDVSTARARVDGAAERAKYTYLAKAQVTGSGKTTPTTVFYLDGLQGGYDGYWTVINADLVYEGVQYFFMDLELGTNSLGPSRVAKPGPLATVAGRPRRVSSPRLQFPSGPVALAQVQQGRGGPTPITWTGSVDTV